MRAVAGVVALTLTGLSCTKVPIFGVAAGFTLADASWFAEEQTLFVFYQVEAEQGLGDPSVVEVTYRTDEGLVDWTSISDLPTVHTHREVDCGAKSMCGSTSLSVPLEPREVGVRLRYHRDGELALDADTVFNVVGFGPPHSHRSLLVYGVFDESNEAIQWRGRHQFPTLRNQRAERLGLRRNVTVRDQRFGTIRAEPEGNPYAYGVTCPEYFAATELPEVFTNARAVFNEDDLPPQASGARMVCAQATVIDALGEFTTAAVARKNPEVRSAFPLLRSPIRNATPIPFFLGPCEDKISPRHKKMQRQRLQMDGVPVTCIDDWDQVGFVDTLAVTFRDAVEAERPAGRDMVLVIALHQDELGVSEVVEEALAQVVPLERHRTTPRLAGAFVFDSTSYGLTRSDLAPVTLWCPAEISLTDIPDASARSCAALPDDTTIDLGPFTFGGLPILPSRDQYLEFVDDFSENQAGEVTALSFLAPEFSTLSDSVDLGEFGVVTFLNGESFGADAGDAFSYCADGELQPFVVRSPLMQGNIASAILMQACAYGLVPPELCEAPALGLLPIEFLPDWHNVFGESSYEVGLFWEFPFLLRLEYQAVLAGAVSALGFSVPFGISNPDESYYGTELWLEDTFSLASLLTQCVRFCDNPTFDSAGVYHIQDDFRSTYTQSCYLPDYPERGDSGFPLDP